MLAMWTPIGNVQMYDNNKCLLFYFRVFGALSSQKKYTEERLVQSFEPWIPYNKNGTKKLSHAPFHTKNYNIRNRKGELAKNGGKIVK